MITHQIPLYSYNDPIIFSRLFPMSPRIGGLISLLHQTAEFVKEVIMNELEDAQEIGIIADGWTNMGKRRFLGVCVYYLTIDGKVITRFAKFSSIDAITHTAKVIFDEISDIPRLYNFGKQKFKVIVSDSCSTMVKASKELELDWIPCYLHLFNICFNSLWNSAPLVAKD